MLNWFDIVITITLVVAFFSGFHKGLVRQLINLITLIIGIAFAGHLAKIFLPWLLQVTELSYTVASVISYLMAFGIIMVILSIIGSIIQELIKIVHLNFLNKLLGSFVSIGIAAIVLSLILNLILILDPKEEIIKKETKQNSFFYEHIQIVVPTLFPYLNSDVWEQYFHKKYRDKTKKDQQSEKTIQTFLPFLQKEFIRNFFNSYRNGAC